MTAPPLVTFAVPAYNHAPYIRECLDKILEEPYPAKELIVIDDGSTDRTAEVVREWLAAHPVAFRTEFISRPNQGLAKTLNELIRRSRGRYFRSSSSDDYLIPGTLTAMVELLERRPDKRMVFGDAIVIDDAGQQVKDSAIFDLYHGRKQNYSTDAGLRDEVINRWSLAGPVQLVRLDLYEEIGGYDESLKIEDLDMMLRMVARNYAIYLDQPVAAYRVHGQNSFKTLYEKDLLRCEIEYLSVIEKNHVLFSGADRRRLDYMIYRQRAKIDCMKRGVRPRRRQRKAVQLGALWYAAMSQLRRIFDGS